MRRTLRKKGISLLSPFGLDSPLHVSFLSFVFLYTHTHDENENKNDDIDECVYIYRGAAKRKAVVVFLRGLLESANKDSAREEEEKSTTEINGQKSHPKESAFLSLFFHIKP